MDPEPIRHLDRRERAEDSRIGAAAVPERQRHELELELALGALRMGARHDADDFACHHGKHVAHQQAVLAAPEIDESLALELAAEGGADAGTGDPEGVTGALVEAEDESVGQHPANGARIDVGAVRRRPQSPLLVPVFEQLAYRRMFHWTLCLAPHVSLWPSP